MTTPIGARTNAPSSGNRMRRVAPGTPSDPALGSALGAIAASTVRLNQMDPVTTELVRMRCADHHDCGT
jgi:hypothetical protein